MKRAAGILVYRYNTQANLEVMLVHPGGPFWKNKQESAWSIPKGEYEEDEDAFAAAKREFTEETGNVLPEQEYVVLAPVKSKSGKLLSVWATEADFEKCFVSSNLFEMEWPPRSGKMCSFHETDDARFMSLEEARKMINKSQLNFLDQLAAMLPANRPATK